MKEVVWFRDVIVFFSVDDTSSHGVAFMALGADASNQSLGYVSLYNGSFKIGDSTEGLKSAKQTVASH